MYHSQKMANVSAEQWSRGSSADPVSRLSQWHPTGLHCLSVTLVVWWKQFSWPLSTLVSSSLNGDADLVCHGDLDCAAIKAHTSEFCETREDYFLLTVHAHLRWAGGSFLYHTYLRTQVNTAVTIWNSASHHTRGERAQEVVSSKCTHLEVTHITSPHKSLARCGSKAKVQSYHVHKREAILLNDKAFIITTITTPILYTKELFYTNYLEHDLE